MSHTVGVCISLAAALGVPAALSPANARQQTPPQASTFIQIFNGSVAATPTTAPRAGDVVAAVVGGQSFTTTLNASLQFQSLTLTRTSNDAANITFELRRGSQRWALVRTATATDQISVPFNGSTNPLSAAFAAQTINAFVGPSLSGDPPGGGGGGGGSNTGDPADIDGDGQITIDDAMIVMRYIVGDRAGVRNPVALDVNGDGRINSDDVIAIMRRIGEPARTGALPAFQTAPGSSTGQTSTQSSGAASNPLTNAAGSTTR